MPKQIIEKGTILYKQVQGRRKDGVVIATGIVSLVVTEPGFMATWEDIVPPEGLKPTQYHFNREEKCRVRAATVLSIEYSFKLSSSSTEQDVVRWTSIHDQDFEYTVGAELRPTQEFNKTDVACSSGIHGFLTREQAVNY